MESVPIMRKHSGSVRDSYKVNDVTNYSFSSVVSNSIHPLRYTWTFWYLCKKKTNKFQSFSASTTMREIASFSDIESFWSIYLHLIRSDDLPINNEFQLFKQGIRPIWEDPANTNGGKWVIKLRRGLTARYWELLLIAIIGEQFDVDDEICGVAVSLKSRSQTISVWNKTSSDGKANLKIRDTLRRVLELPMDTIIEYRPHKTALNELSNYRGSSANPIGSGSIGSIGGSSVSSFDRY